MIGSEPQNCPTAGYYNFQHSVQGVIRKSSGSHQGVIRKPSRSHQKSHQGVIRESSRIIRESSGSHMGIIRESSYLCIFGILKRLFVIIPSQISGPMLIANLHLSKIGGAPWEIQEIRLEG